MVLASLRSSREKAFIVARILAAFLIGTALSVLAGQSIGIAIGIVLASFAAAPWFRKWFFGWILAVAAASVLMAAASFWIRHEFPDLRAGNLQRLVVRKPASASEAEARRSAEVDAIFERWSRPDSPGCVCAVIQSGRVVYAKGYGMANLENGAPLSSDSVFYIASTSKQFTAASVALLSLDGKLSLKDDIHKYFPEFQDYGEPVTVDELIHHTSGIRDYFELLVLTGWHDIDHLDNDRVVKLLARQRELNFKPGTRFLYSNSNYVLLAELVRRVSGQDLPEFAAARIFRPLGMNKTRIESDMSEIVPNRVVSYSRPPGNPGYSQFIKTIESYGDGNVLTTVGDLARWDENFYTGKVGGSQFLKLIQTRGVLDDGKQVDYEFGLMPGMYRGLPIVSHGGAYMGFRTDLLRFPDQHFSVVVLCNLSSMDPDQLARRVADLYLANDLAPAETAQSKAPAAPPRAVIKLDPKLFDAYVGRFALDASPQFILTFTREGDHFYAQNSGQPRFPIFPSSETDFFLQAADEQITFHREADGSVPRLTMHFKGDRDAHRVGENFKLSGPELLQYAGMFHSDELDMSYDLVVGGDHLTARDSQARSVPFVPLERDVFGIKGGRAVFHRDTNGKIDSLRYSSGRVNNLLFVREPSG
jgi:CubicO group peptidase (beta-lactamase class C family)